MQNVCSLCDWSSGQVDILKLCYIFSVKYDTIFSLRLIKHTKKLMEKEEKLCIKILQTLREMLDRKEIFEDKVSVVGTFRNLILAFFMTEYIILVCNYENV